MKSLNILEKLAVFLETSLRELVQEEIELAKEHVPPNSEGEPSSDSGLCGWHLLENCALCEDAFPEETTCFDCGAVISWGDYCETHTKNTKGEIIEGRQETPDQWCERRLKEAAIRLGDKECEDCTVVVKSTDASKDIVLQGLLETDVRDSLDFNNTRRSEEEGVEILNLPVLPHKALADAGIETMGDLLKYPGSLQDLPLMGPKRAKQVYTGLLNWQNEKEADKLVEIERFACEDCGVILPPEAMDNVYPSKRKHKTDTICEGCFRARAAEEKLAMWLDHEGSHDEYKEWYGSLPPEDQTW